MGTALLELADARWSRLAGRNRDRLGAIERLAQLGRRLDDEAILAQTFTALGDELVARGDVEAGIQRYRDVRALLDGSEVPALEVWARNALHREREHKLEDEPLG